MTDSIEEKNPEVAFEGIEKLSDTLNVTLVKTGENTPEETRTVFMSHGLLQTLASNVFDLGQLQNMSLDSGLMSNIINEALDERDGNGKRLHPECNYAFRLSKDEGKKLSGWLEKHLLAFFTSALEEQQKALKELTPALEGWQKELAAVQKVQKSKQL